MSIASEITRINGNIAAAYTALDGKGATLPAAGSQNSANLADTIDTIPTGGGGNAEYTALREVMDKVTPSYTFKKAYEDGWSFNDYYKNSAATDTNALFPASFALYGLYFEYSLTPNILYVYKDGFDAFVGKAVKAPTGAVVTDAKVENGGTASAQSILKIDFTNATEKWLVFADASSGDSVHIKPYYTDNVSAYSHLSGMEDLITWMEYDLISSTYTTSNKYTPTGIGSGSAIGGGRMFDYIINRSTRLKGFNVSDNIYISSSNSTASSATFSNASYIPHAFEPASSAVYDSFVKFINNNTMWTYGAAAISTDFSNGGWYHISRAAYFPFIVDVSTLTNPIYINSHGSYITGGTAKQEFSPIRELFIKVPAQNVEWIQYREGMTSSSFAINYITPASLTYLANNAPSVSGKTLKIGDYNKANNPAAVAILEGKGWTVS